MKSIFTMVTVFVLLSSTALADCRWCAKCNTWHCDTANTSVVSQPILSQPITRTAFSPVTQSYPSQAYQPTTTQQVGNIYSATFTRPRNVAQPVYSQSGYAAEVLRLTNIERGRYGLAPLAMSQNMGAQNHAQRMSSANSMFHGQGYTENVGFGNLSPSQIVGMWMNSPSHRRNILGPYRQLDVGKSGQGWVQRFK